MPDITPNQKAELDKNIRLMISNGASNEDVVRYSNDYREFLKKKESSSIESQDGGIVGISGRPLVYANVGEKPIIGLTTPKEKTGNGLEGIRVIKDKTPLSQLPKEYGQEVIIDEKDPIKSYRSQLSSKQDQSLAKLIQRERQPKAESTAVPPSLKVAEIKREEKAAEKKEEKLLSPIEVDKKVAEAKKVYSEDQNASAVHLSQVTGLSPAAILNTSKEQLQKYIRPGNETDELAVQAVSEARDVKDILGKATSLEEASAYFAGLKDPQIQEQIDRNLIPGTNKVSDVRTILKEGSIGAKMVDFLFNPIVEKEIKNNPALYKEYKATVPVLINKYPEYGKYYVGSKISQKMEEMGINNALVNVVSKEESDKAVDELQKEGKMTQNEVQFYKDNLRDEGGYSNFLRSLVGKQYYTTPGVIENILGGAVKGSMNIATGASELLGLPELVRGKTEINARDISDRDLKFNIAPKGIAHEISMSGGEVIGNLAPFLFGGGEVLAAKTALSPTVANGLLFGLQTYGNNIAEARRLFPGSQVKQRAFATTQSLIDAVLLEKLGSNKIVKALSGEMKPAIENIVNGYATKSLSKEAVQNGIKDAFVSAVKKVPEAASHFVRQTGKNTLIITGLDLAHQINEGVFEGKPVKDLINGQRVFEGARSAAIGSTFLSLLGTAAAMQNKGVTSKLIYQNAEQPDVWEAEIKRVGEQNGESQADIQDKIDNARYASSVYQDLKGDANMTEKQKAKYLLNSLIQRAKTREAEAITDPVLKQRATAEAKKIQEDQEALLDNKDDGTIEGDVSDVIEGENLIEKKREQEAPLPAEEIKVPKDFGEVKIQENSDGTFTPYLEVSIKYPNETVVVSQAIKRETSPVNKFKTKEEAQEIGEKDLLNEWNKSKEGIPSLPAEEKITEEVKTPVGEEVVKEVGEVEPLQKLEEEYRSKSVDELVALKKKLYSDVDIETPMTPEEKLLNKVIADKFSDINQKIVEKRKAEKAEGWKPVEVEGEEISFGETESQEIKAQKEEKSIKNRALNLDATDARSAVLQYFVGGGKISPDAIKKFFGTSEGAQRLRWKKKGAAEQKEYRNLQDKNSPSLDKLAHKLWERHRELGETSDFKNAIEDVLLSHNNTKDMAKELVDDYDMDYQNRLREDERAAIAEKAHEELQDIASRIPSNIRQEILNLLDNFRDSDGFINWGKIEEESNGFNPDLLDLSPESSKFIDNAIEQVKQTGGLSGLPRQGLPLETKAGDVLRKAAEFTRSGKISKLGGFRAGIGFDIVWDRSLEVIAKALDGGATIADAIEAGLKYVKGTGWYKKLENPTDFDKKYREHLKSEYNAVQEPSAGEVLQRPQERAGEAGGKRGGVEQGVKGPEVTKEGKVEGEEREEVTPPVPPTTKEKAIEPTEEPENWSSIRKAKLSEIDSVREMYENKTKKAWSQTYQSGLENVQKMFPDKSLYEAMQSRVAEIQKRMERGELYNPTSEDLAVFNVLNAETAKRIKAVRGLDSSDAIEREMAIAELENLENQQMAIAKVVNPTEAGRAFSIRQAEMMLDENNGLKIRRMQLQKAKGGEPLTEEEEAFVNKNWEQEKALLLEEQQVREEQMKAEFDAKIDELQKKHEEAISKAGKTPASRTKKAKTLSQKGKQAADLIRKLKTPKGASKIDFTLGTWDLAIEGIAQLVEKGATIAEAIDILIKENKIGFKNKEDRDKFEDSLVDKLGQKNREEQVDKIKQFAEENGANDLTNEMVAKNLIKDYFNSLIGEYPKEQIFDEALKELKQILPNITKEGLREAFLKKGDFKQQSRKQLENSIQSQERELKKIAEKELTADQRNKIRLQQEKEKLTRRRDEYKRKIANNEYEESEPPTKVKKYDAELIRIKKEAARVNNEFRQKEKQFKEKNKGAIEKGAEFVKDTMLAILIGAPKTMLKVGAMSIVRPAAETIRKLTIGKLFDHLFPNISKAAQRGGESSNVKTIAKGFEAYFRQMNEKQLDKKYEIANQEYDKAKAEYEDYKDSGSPDAKKLEKLKKAYQEKLVKAQSYFIYKFIGGSSIKDSLKALINRSNEIEKQFGKVSTETIKEEELLKKASYIIGFIGRSHSAFKTFSGRFSFASSFMARLQGAVDAGEDISNPDKILEIAHESYLDWERGKYQQSNAISDAWASFINRRAENQENKGRGAAAKAFRLMMGADVAVTRVPVNILHEGLVEYTFGAFKAINDVLKVNKQMRQELKEAGITNGEKVLDELTEGTSKEEFRKSLKEKISQMDGEQAATIMRCFTKGGVGLGLYAFALIYGGIKFGIFPHKGEKKKKEEWELAPHELNPGEVVVGDKRLSKTASGIIEHIPALFPMFMGLGLSQRYKDNIEEGQTSKEAAAESIYKHLEILQSDVPQIAFFDPLGRAKTTLRIGERRLEEYGLLPEDKVLPKVKDPESGMKRDMTETEGKSYEETLPVNFKEIIEDYRDSDKTVYFDVNGNVVLSKRDYPQKDRSSLESKDYSELSDVEIKKLYKKLKTVAKTKTLKELELEEVEEK